MCFVFCCVLLLFVIGRNNAHSWGFLQLHWCNRRIEEANKQMWSAIDAVNYANTKHNLKITDRLTISIIMLSLVLITALIMISLTIADYEYIGLFLISGFVFVSNIMENGSEDFHGYSSICWAIGLTVSRLTRLFHALQTMFSGLIVSSLTEKWMNEFHKIFRIGLIWHNGQSGTFWRYCVEPPLDTRFFWVAVVSNIANWLEGFPSNLQYMLDMIQETNI